MCKGGKLCENLDFEGLMTGYSLIHLFILQRSEPHQNQSNFNSYEEEEKVQLSRKMAERI